VGCVCDGVCDCVCDGVWGVCEMNVCVRVEWKSFGPEAQSAKARAQSQQSWTIHLRG
jgi:hypothetical protein